jgi:hypothetical protein
MSRRVAHFVGRPAVGGLMNRDGKEDDKELHDDKEGIHVKPRRIYSIRGGKRKD